MAGSVGIMLILFVIAILIGIVAFKEEKKDVNGEPSIIVAYAPKLNELILVYKSDYGAILELGPHYMSGSQLSIDEYDKLVKTEYLIELE